MVNEPRCGSNCKAQRKVPVRMLDGSGHAVRSEKQLLLYCARTCLDPYSAGRIRALADGRLDWPYLLELAAEHCVLPLLYSEVNARTVGQAAQGKIPGQYLFVGDAHRSIVELHTEATLRYFPTPPDLEALSRRTEAVSFASREVLTFSGEDALPILCVHGSKHFWERLLWICDIAQLAHIPRGLDWEVALEQARRLGAERMTLLGLHLANGLLGAAVPHPILRPVQEDRRG